MQSFIFVFHSSTKCRGKSHFLQNLRIEWFGRVTLSRFSRNFCSLFWNGLAIELMCSPFDCKPRRAWAGLLEIARALGSRRKCLRLSLGPWPLHRSPSACSYGRRWLQSWCGAKSPQRTRGACPFLGRHLRCFSSYGWKRWNIAFNIVNPNFYFFQFFPFGLFFFIA